MVKVPFFEDIGTKTLEYLDSLFQVDNLQRSMFYKSLPQVLEKLPMVRLHVDHLLVAFLFVVFSGLIYNVLHQH